jgi:hypothetical protein
MESGSNETFGNESNTATYVGIAKYYDNRKCVVTSSNDDFRSNASAWESCLSMLTSKKIYHTVGIITNETDWGYVQHWLDQGYTEAASHSRNHVHTPYTGADPYNKRLRISYEWQINGSEQDIVGNLSLPSWWRESGRQYVYVWIEPFGSSDSTVKTWLGKCHYLVDRDISSKVYDLASWDPSNGLFNRLGYTVEMGPRFGGDTSVSSLNGKFDRAYEEGKVYHFITHPESVNWTKGGYADQHTDYISNRTDVWYVPLGPLYLYHWVNTRNITQVAFTEQEKYGIFKISTNSIDHETYGVSYPITYVFNIPSNWTSGYAYYRYKEEDPWILMASKSSRDFYNGVDASRFNFSEHKAYVSAALTNVSDNIYLQMLPNATTASPPTAVTVSVSNITENSLKLMWTQSNDAFFARYEVFQSTMAGVLGTSMANITSKTTTIWTATDLSPGTTYYFTVRVVDIEGLYADSAQRSATAAVPLWQQPWFIESIVAIIIVVAVSVLLTRRK